MLDREKAAKEGRENNKEDAGPGILARAMGCPIGGVEWCRGGGEEDHLHH